MPFSLLSSISFVLGFGPEFGFDSGSREFVVFHPFRLSRVESLRLCFDFVVREYREKGRKKMLKNEEGKKERNLTSDRCEEKTKTKERKKDKMKKREMIKSEEGEEGDEEREKSFRMGDQEEKKKKRKKRRISAQGETNLLDQLLRYLQEGSYYQETTNHSHSLEKPFDSSNSPKNC